MSTMMEQLEEDAKNEKKTKAASAKKDAAMSAKAAKDEITSQHGE